MSFFPLQTQPYSLAGSGAVIGATSITLKTMKDIDGNLVTMSSFGSIGFGTLEPGNNSLEEQISFTGITQNANGTATLTGLSSVTFATPYTATSGLMKTHAGSTTFVISNTSGFYNEYPSKINDETITGQWTFTNTPITPPSVSDASTTVKGVTKLSVAPAVAANPIAVGDNDPRITQPVPSGILSPYVGRTAPSGWLICDGSAISRTGTNANLFAVLCPSGIFTVTIASPAVFTKASHGYLVGDLLHFSTTGGFPSGLVANTNYYVISAGLTTNTFEVALSPGGPAINTTGSQSGVHTVYLSSYGKGDGSTTFTLPDFRARYPMSIGQSSYAYSVDSSNVTLASPSVFTIPANFELYQGQAIVLSTTGTLPTGFTPGNTYYVIRASQNATTITLASSQANANAGTGVNGSVSQSGVHTMTYTVTSNRTILGRGGGEETHGIATAELASHSHSINVASGSNPSTVGIGNNTPTSTAATQTTGGDTQHNGMNPFLTVGGWIIKL